MEKEIPKEKISLPASDRIKKYHILEMRTSQYKRIQHTDYVLALSAEMA